MNEPFLGMIQYYGCNFAPYGFRLCDGSLIPISQYAALYSLLGTTFGGNGTSTFGLPDLRGRSMIGFSNTVVMGTMAGHENVTMTSATMPSHTHSAAVQIGANSGGGNLPTPGGNVPAASGKTALLYGSPATSGSNLGAPIVTVGNAGSGPVPFSTLAPYLVLTCTIAMQGIFPARN